MKLTFNIARAFLLCSLVFFVKIANTMPLTIDVRTDLTKLKITDSNVTGDGKTNDSASIQAAIDYLARNSEGGSLVFPPGIYRVGGLVVRPGVKIIGAHREQTIFRAGDRGIMFDMSGGELHNFTAYGTPDELSSGDLWKVGTGGVGRNGSAWTSHIIRVGNMPETIAENVLISNITAKEARYDCLYTRGSKNLRVINCEFDRAGRNIISLVGDDENFLIANTRFGSLFGLYHSDIEPNTGRFVRDGVFLNCEFDGTSAGSMGTGTWGAMFIFSGDQQIHNRNISVIGCTFRDITTRVRGVFPKIQFLYNPQLGRFVKVRTNPTGELLDATVRGNQFGTADKPLENITSGVTFTGESTFEGNLPDAANKTAVTAPSGDVHWEEDHPEAVKAKADLAKNVQNIPSQAGANIVTLPLMGHRFNFTEGKILKNREKGVADIELHIDPLMALDDAGIQSLSPGAKPDPNAYEKSLWGVKNGDRIAVKTHNGKVVIMQILEQLKDSYKISYYFLNS